MTFQTLNERLERVAACALSHCKTRFGNNSVKIEEQIHHSISWRPTFHFKSRRLLIIAIEVDDNLYPEILKGAAHDIIHYNFPIAVYQVCTLEAFQSDFKQEKINKLRDHGFGIITVDDDGGVIIQHQCVPVAQNIPAEQLEADIKQLSPNQKVSFRSAHELYKTNGNQGLHRASQIVEALIKSLGKEAAKRGVISKSSANSNLAHIIDALYDKQVFSRLYASRCDRGPVWPGLRIFREAGAG